MNTVMSLLCLAAWGVTTCPAVAQQDARGVVVLVDDAGVELTVDQLQRTDDGATVLLRATVHNTSGQQVELGHVADMTLTDYKNRRKYMVITDSSLACTCAPGGAVTAPPAGTIRVWAKFPAPPETVTGVSFGWGTGVPATLRIAP